MEDVADATVDINAQLEGYRRELTGFAYRMLGSVFEAEDAVQETMVRAWKGAARFEGRSALRSWLYRIATNVCIDMLKSGQRRALPIDLSPAPSQPVVESLSTQHPTETWVEPVPSSLIAIDDPAETAVQRESVRLAFVAALQELPPRQRAVLILRDVLRWKAAEVAELLGTTTVSVNSALQRAHATMAENQSRSAAPDPLDEEHQALLSRYVEVFERYDIDALVSLLHEDAVQSMPPYALWLSGPDDIAAWHRGPGHDCEGSRMLPIMANGSPGFAQYRRSPSGGHDPWALQTFEVVDGKIASLTAFLDTRLFDVFGLPPHLEDTPSTPSRPDTP